MKDCVRAIGTPVKTVIHIGAHHGEEVKDYAECGVSEVLWVEANPQMMKHLFDNTNKYPVKSSYVNATLSDDKEDMVLNVANNGQSSSILDLGTHAQQYPHIFYTKQIQVMTKRFDQMVGNQVDQNLVNRAEFINLDVQGAELKVLKGFGDLLANSALKAIYTEVNFEEVYKGCCLIGDLDEFLSKYSFVRVATAAPEKTWGDALYIKR